MAEIISNSLNQQESLVQRLHNGLKDCATHTQPFWNALTHRTSEQRGSRGAQPGGQRTRRCMGTKGLIPGEEEAVWTWKKGLELSSVVMEINRRMEDMVRMN